MVHTKAAMRSLYISTFDVVLLHVSFFTMRSKGSSVSAALSSSSLYSSSSHMRCRVLRGSLSSTGMDTLDKSLPMLFLSMFQRLMLLVSGQGAGRPVRRPLRKAQPAKSPLATAKPAPHPPAEITTFICNGHCYSPALDYDDKRLPSNFLKNIFWFTKS